MRLISRSFRFRPTLVERLDRRRDETGVPTTTFLVRLIESTLDKEQRRGKPKRPKTPRRNAG